MRSVILCTLALFAAQPALIADEPPAGEKPLTIDKPLFSDGPLLGKRPLSGFGDSSPPTRGARFALFLQIGDGRVLGRGL